MARAARLDSVKSVLDIDFEEWHTVGGVELLMLDMEGTILPYGCTEVEPIMAQTIKTARQLGQYSALGIITHKSDLDVVRHVANQIEADDFFVPTNKSERKPKPKLIHRAMAEFKQTPQTTGMAGDKYTADVKAALNAQLVRVALTERLGSQDHPGDRIIRRPYEAFVYRMPLSLLGGSKEIDYDEPAIPALYRNQIV